MFNANELKEGMNHSMDSSVGFEMCLLLCEQPRLFKTLTNFPLNEFDELALLVASTIVCHAQSTSDHHIQVLDLGFALKF
jgi:hypothetical protein